MCYIETSQKKISFTGALNFRVKRESGANPERTRRCKKGVLSTMSLNFIWEDGQRKEL